MAKEDRQTPWRQRLLLSAKISVPVLALSYGYVVSSQAAALPSLRLAVRELSPASAPRQSVRAVNPSVRHMASWISAAGAGAALADLDGDGLMNDLCLVDSRSDTVSLSTVSADPAVAAHVVHASLKHLGETRAIAPMGCRFADLNGDGWTDILVYYWGRPPALFTNAGGWKFAAADVITDVNMVRDWYSNAALVADLNGDGLLDLFIGNYFADGTELLDTSSQRRVSLHSSFSRAYNGGTNRVLLQRPGSPGQYDVAPGVFEPQYAQGWTLAAAAADLDGDLLPEVFVANDFGPDQLFSNRSKAEALTLTPIAVRSKNFREPLSHVLGNDSFKGMGVSIADLDNDADFDIVVSNITQRFGLYESHMLFLNMGSKNEPLKFENASEELKTARTGFGWDNKVADLNNDGSPEILQATGFVRGKVDRWPDVQEIALSNDAVVSNPDFWPDLAEGDISGAAPRVVLSRVGAAGAFQNVAEASGLNDTGVTRGIAVADIDGDGDLDWVEANQFADARLVVNKCQPCGPFVGLRLLRVAGTERPTVLAGLVPAQKAGGSAAIGAEVTLTLPKGGRRAAFVDGGNGHSGQQSTDIHIGLAAPASAPHVITVRWRDFKGHIRSTTLEVAQSWQTVLLPSS